MKAIRLTLALVLIYGSTLSLQAQTADAIISNFLENTGGVENWKKLQGFRYTAKLNTQGFELPLEVIQLKDGRQMSSTVFQGKEIKQGVYDGSTLWSVNFMTMKAEANDEETTANFKLNINDFPDPFIDYKAKGYTAELLGKEDIEGTETYKIKLIKEPVTIEGQETEDATYYYFDAEAYVPILVETEVRMGPAKGMIQQTRLSNYDEVDGLYFAFSTMVMMKDQPGGQAIHIQKLTLNPQVDDSIFAMPKN